MANQLPLRNLINMQLGNGILTFAKNARICLGECKKGNARICLGECKKGNARICLRKCSDYETSMSELYCTL